MSDWQSVPEIAGELLGRLAGRLDGERRQAVEDVLEGAAAWQAGELPLQEAARLGVTDGARRWAPGQARLWALQAAPVEDPRRAALVAMVDALVERQGMTRTDHGSFERGELSGVTVRGAA